MAVRREGRTHQKEAKSGQRSCTKASTTPVTKAVSGVGTMCRWWMRWDCTTKEGMRPEWVAECTAN